MMILLLVIGILGSIYLVNYLRGKPGLSLDGLTESIKGEKKDFPLEILQRRLASGEISQNEYNEIRNTIIKDVDL